MRGPLLFCLLWLAACGETEECKSLRELLGKEKTLLAKAKASAGVHDKLLERSGAAEAKAKQALGELWLDRPEGEVQAELERRAKVSGGTLSRGTAPPKSDDPTAQGDTTTLWTIRLGARTLSGALDELERLIAGKPLVLFSGLLEDGPGRWKVELLRATVDQVPINPTAVKLAAAADLAAVQSQLGTCGAGALREQIRGVSAEVDALRTKAEATSVLLPTIASWEGLRSRADQLAAREEENRRLLRIFIEAVQARRLSLLGVGVEGDLVVLEVKGPAAKLRPLLEQEITKRGAGAELRKPEVDPQGITRLILPNARATTRRPAPGAAEDHH